MQCTSSNVCGSQLHAIICLSVNASKPFSYVTRLKHRMTAILWMILCPTSIIWVLHSGPCCPWRVQLYDLVYTYQDIWAAGISLTGVNLVALVKNQLNQLLITRPSTLVLHWIEKSKGSWGNNLSRWPSAVGMPQQFDLRYIDSSYAIHVAGVALLRSTFPPI